MVKSPEDKSISVPSIVILSALRPAFAVTVLLNVAAPASDISKVNAVISEPPSLPLMLKSLSDTVDKISTAVLFEDFNHVTPLS